MPYALQRQALHTITVTYCRFLRFEITNWLLRTYNIRAKRVERCFSGERYKSIKYNKRFETNMKIVVKNIKTNNLDSSWKPRIFRNQLTGQYKLDHLSLNFGTFYLIRLKQLTFMSYTRLLDNGGKEAKVGLDQSSSMPTGEKNCRDRTSL